jgi:hypothetical protein
MKRWLLVFVVLAACSGGGKKAAESGTTASSSAAKTTTSTTTTTASTIPTTTRPTSVDVSQIFEHAGVTLAVAKVRIAESSESLCGLAIRASTSGGISCLAVDETVTVSAYAPAEGIGTFDSYVDPTGNQLDNVVACIVQPGAHESCTDYFPGAAPGGKLHGEVGVMNHDTQKVTLDVPAF